MSSHISSSHVHTPWVHVKLPLSSISHPVAYSFIYLFISLFTSRVPSIGPSESPVRSSWLRETGTLAHNNTGTLRQRTFIKAVNHLGPKHDIWRSTPCKVKLSVFSPTHLCTSVCGVYMLMYVVNSVRCGFHHIDSEVDQGKKRYINWSVRQAGHKQRRGEDEEKKQNPVKDKAKAIRVVILMRFHLIGLSLTVKSCHGNEDSTF